ncbi:hypothetical protein [Chryseobacterium sp. KCF3-3]|uniref:hypothetical protein n=1 Tax=Chryseobacterium sp. KCF3-3 TaxID=3231511 RepID=UPI0038B3F494
MKLKNILTFLSFLYSIFISPQKKVNIIDFETKKPIPQVRVVYNNQISYTNDDGFILLPNEEKYIEIFSPEYGQSIFAVNSIIELKAIYKEIEEIKIRSVDAKKIISSVLKDYNKNYETKASIYNGILKSKSKINNMLNRILVIDMDLWTLANQYIYRKNIDDFIQINLRNKKFDKNRIEDKTYIFNRKDNLNSQESQENNIKIFLQKFFLYNQLYFIDYYTKGLNIKGSIINETGDIQTIKFKTDKMPLNIICCEGIMQYNKKENTIIYMQCNQIQQKAIDKFLNIFDKEYTVSTDLFTVTYDMYKKEGKYIPAKIIMSYKANIMLENKEYPATRTDEFVFSTHSLSNRYGLSSKIDLNKNFLDSIFDNSIKDNKTLLSSEEQKFVDEQ